MEFINKFKYKNKKKIFKYNKNYKKKQKNFKYNKNYNNK